ncbi:hypothetical protein BH11PLA2_BH11PLA2_45460 [soil metagenome]
MAKSKPAKKTKATPKVPVKPKAKAKAPAKPVKKKVAAKSARAAAPVSKRVTKATAPKKATPKKATPKKAAPKKAAPMSPHLLGDAVPSMTAPANGSVLQSGCQFDVTVQTDYCQFGHTVYMVSIENTEVLTDTVKLEMVCLKGNTGAGVGTCTFTAPIKGEWQFYIVYTDDVGEDQKSAGSTVTVQ